MFFLFLFFKKIKFFLIFFEFLDHKKSYSKIFLFFLDLYFTAKSLEIEWFFSENQKNKDQIIFLIFHREKH